MTIPTDTAICVCGHKIHKTVFSQDNWFHIGVGPLWDPAIKRHRPRPRVRDSNGVAP